MNKRAVIKKFIEQLSSELEIYKKAARASHAEATHEQSKAESKYDTRGLEASYLARGQSKQAAEIVQAIEQFGALPTREFTEGEPIDIGALVELEGKDDHAFYFIGPRAGGTEILHEKKEILVLTPQSPLGKQLVGRKQGERLRIEIGGARNEFLIRKVI